MTGMKFFVLDNDIIWIYNFVDISKIVERKK